MHRNHTTPNPNRDDFLHRHVPNGFCTPIKDVVCHTVQLNLPCYIYWHSQFNGSQPIFNFEWWGLFWLFNLIPHAVHVHTCHMPGPLMVPTAHIRIAILYKINMSFFVCTILRIRGLLIKSICQLDEVSFTNWYMLFHPCIDKMLSKRLWGPALAWLSEQRVTSPAAFRWALTERYSRGRAGLQPPSCSLGNWNLY